MSVRNGRIGLFNRHCQRLDEHATRLLMDFDVSQFMLVAREQARNIGNGVLKVLVCSGDGGRGYARPSGAQTLFTITQHTVPAHYSGWQKEGIHLGVSPVKLGIQPALAGLKHLNRLEQVLVKKALESTSFDDAIVLSIENNVIEASASNLFYLKDGQWITPDLSQCGVDGVMRQFILAQAKEVGFTVAEQATTLEELANAEAIMLTNALMQCVPVKSLTVDVTHGFDIEQVHAFSDRLQSRYQAEYDQGY